MICVYDSSEKIFNNNGIKILKPLKALIRKEDNGKYYLDLKDTIDNLEYYQSGMIIRVPTPWGKQAFRLTNPEVENNKLYVRAKHVYYDTENYTIADSYVVDKNCNDALDHLALSCDTLLPFLVLSDVDAINSYRCIRKSYNASIDDVLERWGGHLVRDNFNIEIRQNIGQDRGVSLVSGKNITNIKSSENWDNVVTKILPVGKNGLTLDQVYLTYKQDIYDIPYTKVIDFEQDNIIEDDYKDSDGKLDEIAYTNALKNDLYDKAMLYLEENYLPKINYSLSAYLKDISDVGDTIYVKHPKCKVDIITQVIAVEYDVIRKEFTNIEFGNFRNKLSDLVTKVSESVLKKTNIEINNASTKLQNDLNMATQKLRDVLGNSYVIYDGDKILVLDRLPKEEAINVIMINNGGIGFGNNGINGEFNSIWDINGTLDMQKINVINLVADMIKGGTLKLGSENNQSGIIEVYGLDNNLICKIDKNGINFNINGKESNMSGVITTVEALDGDINNPDTGLKKKAEILQESLDGLTNTIKETGGLNIFPNAAGYFDGVWQGPVETITNTDIQDNTRSKIAFNLKIGTMYQTISIPNGIYTINFKFNKLIQLANIKATINDVDIDLTEDYWKTKVHTFEVTNRSITIKFTSDTDSAGYISDIMGNSGDLPQVWSLNQNETFTDEVQIGKGIRVISTNTDTISEMGSDGNRIRNKTTNEVTTEFTAEGTVTDKITAKKGGTIAQLLIQNINGQVCFNNIGGL